MIKSVNIPKVKIPSVSPILVGWPSKDSDIGISLPKYLLTCDNSEFVKGVAYTVKVSTIKEANKTMTVDVVCEGGKVAPSLFSTDAVSDLTVTPTSDTCIINLMCDGNVVGSFEMSEVLTVPEYIFGSEETTFYQDTEYELILQRVVAPIKQTQIEVACTGGLVSPAFLVDEGNGHDFEGPNAKILVTPTEATCVVTLKVILAGTTYSVGKFTMKAKAPDYSVSNITINQNIQDPATMISGDVNGSEIQKIVENTHVYIAKYLGEDEGMLICPLNGNDGNYTYPDGTQVITDGTEGEFFVKVAPHSSIGEITTDGIDIVKFVYDKEIEGWNYWPDNLLIGANCSKSVGGLPYCTFSLNHSSNITANISEAIDLAKSRGPQFGVYTYAQRSILTFIYYAVYGTTKWVGAPFQNDFLNIGSFVDDWQELLDGFIINNREATITNIDGTQRIAAIPKGDSVMWETEFGYISKIQIGKYLDIIPKEYGATATTGYCSSAYTSPNDNVFPRIKERDKTHLIACGYDSNSTKAYFRLTYQGKITETKDVEYFKSIPIIN